MSWIKGLLICDSGRNIGDSADESVYLNLSNSLLVIKDGGAPYIRHLEGMAQYKFEPKDSSFMEEVFGSMPVEVVQPPEEIVIKAVKPSENKAKTNKKK